MSSNSDVQFIQPGGSGMSSGFSDSNLSMNSTGTPMVSAMSQADSAPADVGAVRRRGSEKDVVSAGDEQKEQTGVSPPPESSPAPIPGLLGYEVGRYLGEGAYGSVYLGKKHPEWKIENAPSMVALKTVRFKGMNLQQQQRELKQIKAEVQLQPKIRHANVCQQLGFDRAQFTDPRSGKTDQVFCFVLELCPNGTLFDHIEGSSRWGEKLARSYFHQLIDGLDACHKQGVAHRDLKPENVLLDENFVLKICDFGMATKFAGYGGDKKMFTHAGTAAYRAPETFSARKGASATGYDKACDVWSAGVVGFIMIAGFPPLKLARRTDWWYDKLCAGNIPLFWRAHEQTAPFGDSAQNRLVKDFIIKILDPDPSSRLTIDQIRQHDWYKQDIFTPEECAGELDRRNRELHAFQMKQAGTAQANYQGTRAATTGGAPEPPILEEDKAIELIGGWKVDNTDSLEKICPKLDKYSMPTRQWFESEETPREIMTKVVTVLKNNGCKVAVDCANFNIEACMTMATQKQPAEKADDLPSTAAPEIIKFQVEVRDKGRCMYQVTFRRLFGCPLQYGKIYKRILAGEQGINKSYPKMIYVS